MKPHILLIASLKVARPLNTILGPSYRISLARTAERALHAVTRETPDLILLDDTLRTSAGEEICPLLKRDGSPTENTPVILLFQREGHKGRSVSQLGAEDDLRQPFCPSLTRRRVHQWLRIRELEDARERYAETLESTVRQRTHDLEEMMRSAVFMLGDAGHYNDTDTGVHIWRMAAYSAVLAREAGWQQEQIELLEMAAPMHDTGKIGIPDAILKAPRKLTMEEWTVMRQHTTIGHQILAKSDTPLFRMAADVALYHHEKWDGSGYPTGLSGLEIPESARIVAIADVFDALTMKRPYKEPWPVDKAVATLQKDAGAHFDPTCIELFSDVLPEILQVKEQFEEREAQEEAVE
ncbi:MAG: HD domain-containing protein [Magnetococcales bacterium]|nr:HD domain-containing protein [Magnetococcales bacterium]